MPALETAVSFTVDNTSLMWNTPTGSQSIDFPSDKTMKAILETLEQQYGFTFEGNHYYFTLQGAFNLTWESCPYLAKDGRMDWLMLKSKLDKPQLHGSIQTKDIPVDFHEVLKKALHHLMKQYSQSQQKELAYSSEHEQVETHIPYDLSGLKTTNQLERFKYVYEQKPTIQNLIERFELKKAGAWREYVRSTLNPKLTDCSIAHNPEKGVWEVIAKCN